MHKSLRFSVLASVVLLAFITAACGGASGGTGGGGSAGKPEDAAKAFVDAVFSGKDVTPYVCSSDAAALKSELSKIGSAGGSVDTSGLTYSASDVSSDRATVTINGTMKISSGGQTVNAPAPWTSLPMKNENGAWKWCSGR